MKKIIILLFILITSVTFYFLKRPKNQPVKNILVISFCSLSAHELPLYNQNVSAEDFPNFNRFFNQSINYTNAHGSTSWLNIGYFIFNQKWFETFKTPEEKNQPIMDWSSNNVDATMIRIPGERDLITGYSENYSDDRSQLPFHEFDQTFNIVEKRLNSPGQKLIILHYKIMHYPFLSNDLLDNKELMSKTFSPDELLLINEYFQNPDQYLNKMAFFQFLFGDKKFKNYYKINPNQYAAFVTIPKEVEKWKQSKNFQKDQQILLKAYRLRLKLADQLIGKWQTHFKKFEKNTALVLAGDHGETFGQYNYLSHGIIPYDEVTRFFFAIHFPFQSEKIVIDKQVSQKSLGHLLEDIAQKKFTFNTLDTKKYIKTSDDYIFAYSCAGDMGSVRVNSKWKAIHNFKENHTQLFDLATDPLEMHDISSQYQELTLSLKLEIEERLAKRTISSTTCIK